MKGIKNQYNAEALKQFKECAKYAFEAQEIDRNNVAARVFKLGEIGPNGLVRLHIRPNATFIGNNRKVKDKIAAMIATADDATFGKTDSGSEIIITVGVVGIVTNWDEDHAEETDDTHFYRSLEEIV